MWIVFLILGVFIGGIAGFVLAAMAVCESDKRAVSDGVIKLCGKLFVLKEIDT